MGTSISFPNEATDYEDTTRINESAYMEELRGQSHTGRANQEQEEAEIARLNKKFQFPADLKNAMDHRRANKFGFAREKVNEQKEEDTCPCCQSYILLQEFSWCSQPTTFMCGSIEKDEEMLPSGIALFFTYIKYIFIMMWIRFFCVDGFNLLSSLVDGKYCYINCSKSLWTYSSVIYKINAEQQMLMTNIFSFITIFVLIVYSLIYRRVLISLYDRLDQKQTSQDDFSIFVTNIPIVNIGPDGASDNQQFDNDHELIEFFDKKVSKWRDQNFQNPQQFSKSQYLQNSFKKIYEEYEQDNRQDTVKSVTLCFDITRIQRIEEVREKLMLEQQDLVGSQKQGEQSNKIQQEEDDGNEGANNIEKVKYLNRMQVKLENSYSETFKDPTMSVSQFVGSAYVCFRYQHYRDFILRSYQQNKSKFKLKGRQLSIVKGSHPTETLWENLVVSRGQRIAKMAVSFFILFVFLIVAFEGLAYSDKFKSFVMQFVEREGEQKKSPLLVTIGGTGVSFITTVVTMIINWFLELFSGWLTTWESHPTKSDQKLSLTIKLVVTQFVNTVLIYYFVSLWINEETVEDLLSTEGLVFQISSLIVTEGFIQIFMNFFGLSLDQVYTKAKFIWEYWCKEEGEVDKFQVHVNQDYQLEEFDLASRYAFYILQLFTISFYAFLVPIGGFALTGILFAMYWVDKYNLFKRCSIPFQYRFSYSKNMVKIGECSILIYSVGVLLFSIKASGQPHPLNIVGVVIAFLFVLSNYLSFLFPSWVEDFVFGRQKCFELQSYNTCMIKGLFDSTYWTENPATFLRKQPIFKNKVPYYVSRTYNE